MPDYKAMYYMLAAQVAHTIDLLVQAQRRAEEMALHEVDVVDIASSTEPQQTEEPAQPR